MERLNPVSVNHYPFRLGEDRNIIRQAVFAQIEGLFDLFSLERLQIVELLDCIKAYFSRAEGMFKFEEEARGRGEEFATLYYHLVDHAVYQITFDAAATSIAILARGDVLSSHLTIEGAVASLVGSMFHDTGYVSFPNSKNYAALLPVHVDKSVENVSKAVKEIGLPPFLNENRVKTMAALGVHNTYFPFTDDHKKYRARYTKYMSGEQRKEAYVVALTTQFADLGGQIARVDYFPNLLMDLRREFNAISYGFGTEIIGEDLEMAAKSCAFIHNMVLPTVGRTGNAFFGTTNHNYAQAWYAPCLG